MTHPPASGTPDAPPLPRPILSLGVTGHRENNAVYAAGAERVAAVIDGLFERIVALADRAVAAAAVSGAVSGAGGAAPIRMHSLLADGTDQLAARAAQARGWQLVAPLPFGLGLNVAINAHPRTASEARLLAAGGIPADAALAARAAAIRTLAAGAHLFELADDDERVAGLYHAMLDGPGEVEAVQRFTAVLSQRVSLAGRILVEQSDIIIGVWDGRSRDALGGTGHTVATALDAGAAVVLIDPAAPEDWRVLRSLEALGLPEHGHRREALLEAAVARALDPGGDGGKVALAPSKWRDTSNPLFHTYRRVEALFGGDADPWRPLGEAYERPDAVATGSGAPLLRALKALPGGDHGYPQRVARAVLERLAWADGIATRLSDLYRGGMAGNFVASGLAVVLGLLYLPLKLDAYKWLFASIEFVLLSTILIVIQLGRRGHWHDRWFETRRVAEYLRHAPILMALGAARPPGRWPRAAGGTWPEHLARHAVREAGLPRLVVTRAYLRMLLEGLLDNHLTGQRDYHRAKAVRLNRVHHRLERLSGLLFFLAFLSVTLWLLIAAGAALGLLPAGLPDALAKPFTFLGVFFPTFGGAVAGIHYFGDFDRFAAISHVSAERLDSIHRRAQQLLAGPAAMLDYGNVADLARAADAAVVAEIESWQAVFAGKHFTVPV